MELDQSGLLTPSNESAVGENNFSGFCDDTEVSTKLWQRRVLALESDMEKLMEKFRAMEET